MALFGLTATLLGVVAISPALYKELSEIFRKSKIVAK